MSEKVQVTLLYASEMIFSIGETQHGGLLVAKKVKYKDGSIVNQYNIEIGRRTFAELKKGIVRRDPGITP